MDWELVVKHKELVSIGLDGGRSSLRVVPPAPGWSARDLVLRLVMPPARPVVRVRRRYDAADGTRTHVELAPTVRSGRQCTLEYPVDTAAGEDAARFELDWEARRSADGQETAGDEQLLTRIHLVAPLPDGGDRLLAAALLRLIWCDPRDRESVNLLLLQAAADESLAGPVRTALAELAEADRAAVPACSYCILRWELRLLHAADRARDAVRGCSRLAGLPELLDTTTDGRTFSRPCGCWRQNPGRAGLAPEIPEDELRRDLAAARARHAARRTAPPTL
ncbi:hypothetical protein [Kitasatospora sp. DSM 101779]|uniref:hypothetical protein n=1 Tax=Kitasatospora sp. DSM 101779 TaxID=2853165 RepID=UPI0021D9ACEB|nr:hypothetical protein [Kitasatospora sp. DSM 101779]MCU7820807.1 hypothetical protein [Kitasatospora sp. DSM 101779]